MLLAVGSLVTVLLAVMPDAFYRFLAFPNAIAMVALGYSLWRYRTHRHHDAADLGRRLARGHHGGCRMTSTPSRTPDRRRSAGRVAGTGRAGTSRWRWLSSASSRWSPGHCGCSRSPAARS